MSKAATTTFPIIDVTKQRWSPRAFANRPVPGQALQQLFEAAAWAPSAMKEQPWRYIYARRARIGLPETVRLPDTRQPALGPPRPAAGAGPH